MNDSDIMAVARAEFADVFTNHSVDYLRGYAAGIKDQINLTRKELDNAAYALSLLTRLVDERAAA